MSTKQNIYYRRVRKKQKYPVLKTKAWEGASPAPGDRLLHLLNLPKPPRRDPDQCHSGCEIQLGRNPWLGEEAAAALYGILPLLQKRPSEEVKV